ncbi:hypothetical protein [Nitrosomonas aestuarii]|uniref:hypothetical protein n=1 Tax=Nitrosomonas aestuarii TaxID=52441 RepID=UPI000D3119C9|nr:hypothetical protein [Nitrosomonas aestuarii]PTN11569.1 hypothetical protein C8R11_109113 [Nitrosomonas aestuarii]
MPRHKRSIGNRKVRNLTTEGREIAKFTTKTADSMFRLSTTAQSGMKKAFDYMPQIGLLNSIKYALVYLLIAVVGTALQIVWILVLIVFGLPFLISLFFQ